MEQERLEVEVRVGVGVGVGISKLALKLTNYAPMAYDQLHHRGCEFAPNTLH